MAARRPEPPSIRQVEGSEVAEVATALARAFDDDPITNFVFRTPRRRRLGLRAFFRTQLRQHLPYRAVYTVDGLAGAAVWAPPDKPVATGLRALTAVLPAVPFVVGNLTRSARHLGHLDRARPRSPHWYLATLGTVPERQGHGIGSALMQPVLDRCDAEGLPAYLESSKERNVPFYRRHGFEVVERVGSDDGPPVWTMWREPRSR